MTLYDGKSRAYRRMYVPHAKKFLPKLFKDMDDYIRSCDREERMTYLWNTESASFGEDDTDFIVVIVDSRQSDIEIMGDLFLHRALRKSKYVISDYKTYSYHHYDRRSHQISTWDRMIPVVGISKVLKIKLGWLKEVVRYGE